MKISNRISDLGVSPRRRANFVLLGPEILIFTFLHNRQAIVTIFDVFASTPCKKSTLAEVGRTFSPPLPSPPPKQSKAKQSKATQSNRMLQMLAIVQASRVNRFWRGSSCSAQRRTPSLSLTCTWVTPRDTRATSAHIRRLANNQTNKQTHTQNKQNK